MIDDDDVRDMMIIGSGAGPIVGLIFAVVVIVVAVYACQNKQECHKRHCDHGRAELVKGQCLCVEDAK